MQVCTIASGQTASIAAGRPVRPSQTTISAAGVEADDDPVQAVEAALAPACHLRVERARPVPGHLEIDRAGLAVQPFGRGAVAGVAGAGPLVRLVAQMLDQLLGQPEAAALVARPLLRSRSRPVQTPARVNVTCVTPLGEEVVSTL
jgi:hypothetical protein